MHPVFGAGFRPAVSSVADLISTPMALTFAAMGRRLDILSMPLECNDYENDRKDNTAPKNDKRKYDSHNSHAENVVDVFHGSQVQRMVRR